MALSTNEFPGQVDIVTSEEITRSGARTVTELLEHQAGIHLNDEQGNSGQMDLTMRGEIVSSVTGLGQGISVYVDGVRVNEADGEEVNFDLLPLHDVEQIEIIRGPHPIFGRNTLGGAINLITRRGKGLLHSSVEAGFGSYLTQKLRLRTEGSIDQLGYYVGIGLQGQQGWRDASKEQIVQAFTRFDYDFGATTLALTGQFNVNQFYQPGSVPQNLLASDPRANLSPGDNYQPTLWMANLHLGHKLTPAMDLGVRFFVRQLALQQFNVNAISTDTLMSTTLLTTGGSVQWVAAQRLGPLHNKIVTGAEAVLGNIDMLIYQKQNQVSLNQCVSSSSLEDCPLSDLTDRIADRQVAGGVYLQDSLQIPFKGLTDHDSVSIFAAVRADITSHNVVDTSPDNPGLASGKGDYKTITPSVGVRLTSVVDAYARFSQGFRAPSFLELLCASSTAPCIGLEAGVAPDTSFTLLQPVTANNYELGFQAQLPREVEARVSLYQTNLSNDIFSVSPNGSSNLYFANVGNTRRRGIETSASWRNLTWDLHADYTYTLATFESDTQLETPRTGNVENIKPGNQLSLMPNHKGEVSAIYRIISGLSVSGSILCVGSQYFRGDEENSQKPLHGYSRVTLGAAYQTDTLLVSIQAMNVLNAKYETFATYAPNPTLPNTPVQNFYTPGLPVNFSVGASYAF